MKKTDIDETVISRLRKIRTLAERGETGEAEAARRLLEQQLSKYGLTLEDLASEKRKLRTFKYSNKRELQLLAHVLYNQFGTKSEVGKNSTYNSSRKVMMTEMTDLEYADFAPLWDYYRKNFKREIQKLEKDFLHAFIVKFRLFDISEKEETESKQKNELSYEEIKRILELAGTISVNPYRRALEEH